MTGTGRILIALMVIVLCVLWGNSTLIWAKAHIAQTLIATAWKKTLDDGGNHKPWPWADTWPVAKLQLPEHELTLYVLAGGHSEALAFGPTHIPASNTPSQARGKVFAGHRDTHFRFLRHIQMDKDTLILEDRHGTQKFYKFTYSVIADVRHGELKIDLTQDSVSLITCYPFDALRPGGPLRYVVTAEPPGAQIVK